MEMVELAAETQEKIINFLSHYGIATGDALCFLSKHEIKMGKHKDLRSSLDDLHKLHACLRFEPQGKGIDLIKCKAELINMLALVELRHQQWLHHCKNFDKLSAQVIKEELDEIKDSVLKNMAQPAKLDGSQHVDDSQGFGDSQVCHSQPEEKPAGPISKKAKTEI